MVTRTSARRRTRTQDGEARGAILAATERLLSAHPLHELSVTDIANEAGVSRASFYFYFASKPGVLAALAQHVCDQIIDQWDVFFDGTGPVDDKELRARFQATVALWTEHRPTLTATVESWRHDEEVGAMWIGLMEEFIDRTRARIEQAAAAGDMPSESIPQVASAVVWATERTLYVGLAGIDPALADPEHLVEALVVLWSRMLSAG